VPVWAGWILIKSKYIQTIKLAQNDKGLNFYLSAILEDRIHFFQAEIKALKQLQKQ
jgi:hypothetical protein